MPQQRDPRRRLILPDWENWRGSRWQKAVRPSDGDGQVLIGPWTGAPHYIIQAEFMRVDEVKGDGQNLIPPRYHSLSERILTIRIEGEILVEHGPKRHKCPCCACDLVSTETVPQFMRVYDGEWHDRVPASWETINEWTDEVDRHYRPWMWMDPESYFRKLEQERVGATP